MMASTPIQENNMVKCKLLVALTATILALPASHAGAQSYPTKPIKLVLPYAPGGATDFIGRTLAQYLGETIGQPVVAENRTGSGGIPGTDYVVRSAPDGYTLVMMDPALVINPTLLQSVPFDVFKDLQVVSRVNSSPLVLVVSPSLPAKSYAEFLAYAKANPGKLNFGTPSGALPHLVGELFKMKTGIDFVTIPYRGAATTVTDMLTGQIDMAFEPTSVTLTHIHDSKIRPLAITSAKRSPLLPEIPTIQESALPGFEAVSWTGLVTTGGTPPEIIATLNRAVTDAVRSAEMTQALGRLGGEGMTGTPQEFAALLARDSAKWIEVVKTAGIKIE
jgi:tripartite-type tricarboxylate transporter receptor subunit TctC